MLPNFGKLPFMSNLPRNTGQIDALGLEKAVISTHIDLQDNSGEFHRSVS